MQHAFVRLITISALIVGVFSAIRTPSFSQSIPTCTVITNSGKEYVGCKRNGYEYALNRSVRGIASFSATKDNPHNPGCFDVHANGVIAICTYKR